MRCDCITIGPGLVSCRCEKEATLVRGMNNYCDNCTIELDNVDDVSKDKELKNFLDSLPSRDIIAAVERLGLKVI